MYFSIYLPILSINILLRLHLCDSCNIECNIIYNQRLVSDRWYKIRERWRKWLRPPLSKSAIWHSVGAQPILIASKDCHVLFSASSRPYFFDKASKFPKGLILRRPPGDISGVCIGWIMGGWTVSESSPDSNTINNIGRYQTITQTLWSFYKYRYGKKLVFFF